MLYELAFSEFNLNFKLLPEPVIPWLYPTLFGSLGSQEKLFRWQHWSGERVWRHGGLDSLNSQDLAVVQ